MGLGMLFVVLCVATHRHVMSMLLHVYVCVVTCVVMCSPCMCIYYVICVVVCCLCAGI